MDKRTERIRETIEVLKQYMIDHGASFESAISDWDEPWDFQYLYDVVNLHRNEKPDPIEICQLAGVNKSYWATFTKGVS